MNAKRPVLWILVIAIALLAELGVMRAQTGGNADAVAAVTKLENDGVKADLANDKAFYQKVLVEDWTGGDSGGTWFTKADVLKMADDTKNNKTNSEKLSDLKSARLRYNGGRDLQGHLRRDDDGKRPLANHHRYGHVRQNGRRVEAGRQSRVRDEIAVQAGVLRRRLIRGA